jgi:hypothetical protein
VTLVKLFRPGASPQNPIRFGQSLAHTVMPAKAGIHALLSATQNRFFVRLEQKAVSSPRPSIQKRHAHEHAATISQAGTLKLS